MLREPYTHNKFPIAKPLKDCKYPPLRIPTHSAIEETLKSGFLVQEITLNDTRMGTFAALCIGVALSAIAAITLELGFVGR